MYSEPGKAEKNRPVQENIDTLIVYMTNDDLRKTASKPLHWQVSIPDGLHTTALYFLQTHEVVEVDDNLQYQIVEISKADKEIHSFTGPSGTPSSEHLITYVRVFN